MVLQDVNTVLITSVRFFYKRSLKDIRKGQQAQTFQKVLKQHVSKKKSKYTSPVVGAPSVSLKDVVTSLTPSRAPIKRRVDVLNKLFMRSITDILSTGELSEEIVDNNVQISHVKVASEFNYITAYWIPTGTDKDGFLQDKLNAIAFPLRHKLTQMRVIGLVPPITFSKDKHYALLQEVDRRLKLCNLEGINDEEEVKNLKKEFTLTTNLPLEVREQIYNSEHELEYNEDEEIPLPPMAMNVFGLDYNYISNTIKSVKPIAGKYSNIVFENALLPDSGESDNTAMNHKMLKNFIKKRKIDAMKIHYERCNQWKLDVLNTQLTDNECEKNEPTFEELLKEFTYEDFVDDFKEDEWREEFRQ